MNRNLPLNDQDFAEVRRAVMAEIEARASRRSTAMRVTGLAFAGVIAFVAVLSMWPDRTSSPSAPPQSHRRPPFASAPPVGSRGPSTPAITSAPQPEVHASLGEKERPRPHQHQTTHRVTDASRHEAHDSEPIRLELATDDPDVRIIWIANANESTTGELQ